MNPIFAYTIKEESTNPTLEKMVPPPDTGTLPIEELEPITKRFEKDWMLNYWRRFITPHLTGEWIYFRTIDTSLLSSAPRLIREIIRLWKFAPLENVVKEVGGKILAGYKYELDIEILDDPDDFSEIMVVRANIDEEDYDKIFDLWKKLSNDIRSKIEKRFGKESSYYQKLLSISVRPLKKED
ncbi:hypothetical protein DRP05_15200 [Archaeoglobales archaeon]|nr:MAG: hypothetical protein DRP05_15200 [Archaeoglobales archaeon]